MRKRYLVDLTPDERAQLIALTRKGKVSARQVTRAHVLLHAADGLADADIAVAAHTSVPTVARIRKRFMQGQVEEAITEIELSSLGRQCLNRRIPNADTLRQEVAAWEQVRNEQHATGSWHFTTADARRKLERFYS
jgi:Homeodomain-like domain